MIRFVENLTINSGQGAGGPFLLRSWQKEIIRGIYDPATPDGRRIVRTALITLPRKQGKSAIAAALALYHLLGDRERSGQVYSAAADRNQASLVFNEAAAMVRTDPDLASMLNIIDSQKRIVHYASGSFYQAISADARTKHGFNASCVIYDELAQAPNRNLYDVLTTSMGARDQPLTIVISTTSSDPHSIMSELVEYGKKVRDGVIDDPTFFPVIYQAPADADPWTEETWHACNPALGDFRSIEEMRVFAERAKRIPSLESTFRSLYLNQPVDADQRFLSSADWDACDEPPDLDRLAGRPCYGGLDLSSTQDLTALILVFPDDNDPPSYDVVSFFWTASDTLRDRGDRDRVPYAVWRDEGFLEATPGRVIDKGYVVRQLAEIIARFDVQGIAYDRYRIEELKKLLGDEGIDVPGLAEWGQGYKDMAPAVDTLGDLVVEGRLRHGGHPVLRWNASNACVTQDPAANRKLDKMRSIGRIDGLVALAMALGLAVRTAAPERSGYEDLQGFFFVG